MLKQLIFIKSYLMSIKSQKGVTMIEYALIAALVAVVAITGLNILGPAINQAFTDIAGNL